MHGNQNAAKRYFSYGWRTQGYQLTFQHYYSDKHRDPWFKNRRDRHARGGTVKTASARHIDMCLKPSVLSANSGSTY